MNKNFKKYISLSLNNIIIKIKDKINEFKTINPIKFSDMISGYKKNKEKFDVLIPQKFGVYIIFENKTPIYVGSTSNLRKRISDFIFHHINPKANTHILTEKLVKERFKTKKGFYNFLRSKCILIPITTNSLIEAKILEAILIGILKPKYNAEIRK